MIEDSMRVLGVIPARIGSTRLEKKPLVKILDKPLIQWVIEGAKSSKSLDKLIVATDSQEIVQIAEACDVKGVLTDPDLPSGTDRVWAASKDLDFDVIVNIQGDEPLLQSFWIDALLKPFSTNLECKMSTVATDLDWNELSEPSVVKVLLNRDSQAIYFSRFPIPHSKKTEGQMELLPLKHIGLYAYKKEFLQAFCSQSPTPLEMAESLEQLRAMWLGEKIYVERISGESIGVDTPEDVIKASRLLRGEKS